MGLYNLAGFPLGQYGQDMAACRSAFLFSSKSDHILRVLPQLITPYLFGHAGVVLVARLGELEIGLVHSFDVAKKLALESAPS